MSLETCYVSSHLAVISIYLFFIETFLNIIENLISEQLKNFQGCLIPAVCHKCTCQEPVKRKVSGVFSSLDLSGYGYQHEDYQ